MSMKFAHVDGPALGSLQDLLWIADIPQIAARSHPDRDAIIFADRQIHVSYAELDAYSNGFAQRLRRLGLEPGQRIAYLGKNSDLFYVVLFGAIRAGLILVPINWRLATPEILYQLADSDARLLIHDPELAGAANAAVIGLDQPVVLLPTEGQGGLREQLIAADAPPEAIGASDRLILQLYTSGTTGIPKGVLIGHRAMSVARHAELVAQDFAHVASGSVFLSAMPNFHIGGMSWVMIGLVRQGTVVITADPAAANLLRLIDRYAVRHTWMVPTLVRAIVDTVRADPSLPVPRFDGLFYGAMPMDVELLKDSMAMFQCSFVQFFGMTEVGGAAAALGPADHDPARPALLKSVGKPYPGVEIEIRDLDRRLLPRGVPGEIWIKSPSVMQGYWNLPDKTAESLQDGWYASGDGGFIDENGHLFLTDRIKEMIVTGGENVYPVEVEQALRRHPAVLDAAVVGLPDPRWGERVTAVVELRHGNRVSADVLIEFCHGRIADYKCPKQVHFTPALPRTASGKVQRILVRNTLLKP